MNLKLDYFIRIDRSVMDIINNYRQSVSNNLPEGCGIIIGEVRNKSLWVKDISVPCASDIRSRYQFLRTVDGHQLFLNNLHNISGGYLRYIGEWHTHPELYPKPSNADYLGWSVLVANTEFSSSHKLFWIASSNDYEDDWLQLIFGGQYYSLSRVK